MLGIPNYDPRFYSDTQEIVNELGKELIRFIGKSISCVWIVWNGKTNEVFKSCPVILIIEGNQLEICCYEIDQISITINKIDMSQKLDWYGADDLTLYWKRDSILEQAFVRKRIVKNIELIECEYTTQKVLNRRVPLLIEKQNCNWLLNGVGFELEDGYFSVYNGLDENEISVKPNPSGYTRTFKLI